MEELQDRIEVTGEGGRVSLVEDNEHVTPGGAEMLKATIPVKPLTLVTVIVALPREPTLTDPGVTDPADI